MFLFCLAPKNRVIIHILLFFLFSLALYAQTKIANAVRISSAPTIDGYLDDDVWKQAIQITDFLQQEPIAGTQPSFPTEVRIIYDDNNLYFGVMCYDSEPEKIIARELKWDGFISRDDNVKLIFDTFNDNRSAYWFGTNPLGAQNDALLTGFEFRDFNEDWDAVWEVECKILVNGWSAEFRFPFSTFKFYDNKDQIWGLNIERGIRRNNEEVLWTSIGQNLGLEKIAAAGDLIGIQNIKRGNPIYLMPYFTAGAQYQDGEKKFVHEPGLDVKYGITETFSLDATINTDFAQVESDRAQINLSRFPLFFPEKREFFLEGMKTFDFNLGGSNNLFYSRRIGISSGQEIPIIAGAKLVGRVGDFEIGAINMQTAEKGDVPTTNFSVARAKYDLFGSSSIGFLFTNKISSSGYNRGFGGDVNFSFNDFLGDKNLIIRANLAKSDEQNGAKNSWAGNFFVDYPNDLIDQFVSYRFIQSNFNPAMGFVSRKGIQAFFYRLNISPRVNWNGIKKLHFTPFESSFTYDSKGELIAANFEFQPLGISTDAGDELRFDIDRNFDYLDKDFKIFDTAIIYAGKYWFTDYSVSLESSSARDMSGEISYSTGNYYSGKRNSFSVEYNYTVSKHLILSADYSYSKIKLGSGEFSTSEVVGRIGYNFSTRINSSIFAQWNNEYNEVNINYRFNWKPKIGSDFYIVINHLLSTENKLKSKDIAILAKFVWMIVI